jgi:NAD(P)-dependent dehydrogenase (short-subunit alcohol dehydrogenase family)
VTLKETSVTTKSVRAFELNAGLRGKVAVVTGAARGIGRATAVALAREGADLVGIDICASVDPRSGVEPANPDDLKETGRVVEAAGRRWTMLPERSPIGLTPEYANDLNHVRQWAAFTEGLGAKAIPGLGVVIEEVTEFVLPPAIAAATARLFNQRWKPENRWEPAR